MFTRPLVASLIALGACPTVSTANEIPSISVAATDFLAASAGVTAGGNEVRLAAGNEWFSFEAEIPVAGR